jgi:DNA recombination protein RmuC
MDSASFISFLGFGLAFFLAALSVWLLMKNVRSEMTIKALKEKLSGEQELLENARTQLGNAFQSLAATALKSNNEQFIVLAKEVLAKQTQAAQGDLTQKQQAVAALIKPIQETLDKYQKHVGDLEKNRGESLARLETEIKHVMETGRVLSVETRALKDALKKPHVRGRWGELQLRNCIELSGMSEYADVTFQDASHDQDGDLMIPDMTVKMPGGRVVVVDAKTPIDAFIASLEATTDEMRNAEMARHGRQVKDHVRRLATRAYSEKLASSPDFMVMFLPNESFLYGALEAEPHLVEFALEKKILIATPPTLVGLLKVIRYGWNEEKLARNAQQISEAGKELHKRLVDFVETFVDIGKHIDKAKEKYDTGMRSLNSRVIVQARRMEMLGAKGNKELPEELDVLPNVEDSHGGAPREAPESFVPLRVAHATPASGMERPLLK